jgi:hypothetical protein
VGSKCDSETPRRMPARGITGKPDGGNGDVRRFRHYGGSDLRRYRLGAAAPAVPLANATVPSQVSLGNAPLTVLFAGLTPGTAGVYQVNAVLPQTLAQTASAALAVSAGGQTASIQLPGSIILAK